MNNNEFTIDITQQDLSEAKKVIPKDTLICPRCLNIPKLSLIPVDDLMKVKIECEVCDNNEEIPLHEYLTNINEYKQKVLKCNSEPNHGDFNSVQYCTKCKLYQCVSCADKHNKFCNNEHKVISVNMFNTEKMYCNEHTKRYVAYCLNCKKHLCDKCDLQKHLNEKGDKEEEEKNKNIRKMKKKNEEKEKKQSYTAENVIFFKNFNRKFTNNETEEEWFNIVKFKKNRDWINSKLFDELAKFKDFLKELVQKIEELETKFKNTLADVSQFSEFLLNNYKKDFPNYKQLINLLSCHKKIELSDEIKDLQREAHNEYFSLKGETFFKEQKFTIFKNDKWFEEEDITKKMNEKNDYKYDEKDEKIIETVSEKDKDKNDFLINNLEILDIDQVKLLKDNRLCILDKKDTFYFYNLKDNKIDFKNKINCRRVYKFEQLEDGTFAAVLKEDKEEDENNYLKFYELAQNEMKEIDKIKLNEENDADKLVLFNKDKLIMEYFNYDKDKYYFEIWDPNEDEPIYKEIYKESLDLIKAINDEVFATLRKGETLIAKTNYSDFKFYKFENKKIKNKYSFRLKPDDDDWNSPEEILTISQTKFGIYTSDYIKIYDASDFKMLQKIEIEIQDLPIFYNDNLIISHSYRGFLINANIENKKISKAFIGKEDSLYNLILLPKKQIAIVTRNYIKIFDLEKIDFIEKKENESDSD